MAKEVRYQEWYDQFAATKFPFEDRCTLTSDNRRVIPSHVFRDARFNLVGVSGPVRLSSITVVDDVINFRISDSVDSLLASASVPASFSGRLIKFTDASNLSAGVMVVDRGSLSVFKAWGPGSYEFGAGATGLVASTYMTFPSKVVGGIVLDSGEVLSGNVTLVGADGVVLTHSTDTVNKPNSLDNEQLEVINVNIVGDPLFKRRLCPDSELFGSPQFIQQVCFSIPGRSGDPNYSDKDPEIVCCGPGDFGDIKIMSGQNDSDTSILRVRVSQGGITIETIGEGVS